MRSHATAPHPSPNVYTRRWYHRAVALIVMALMFLGVLMPYRASADPEVAQGALPKPDNISCQGYEEDTVRVRWKDTASNETNYRVERSIDGSAFTEVTTMTPDSNGNYGAYEDTGIDTSKNYRYRVRSFRSSDNSYSPYSDICNNRRIYESDNFRFFYGLRGTSDDCPDINGRDVCLEDVDNSSGVNVHIARQENALEGSIDAFTRVGFSRDAGDYGSLAKSPINVVWCDGGGCAGGGGMGLSPWLIEKPFNLNTRVGDPVAWLVAMHETFHFQQFRYWGLNDPNGAWVMEGQARSAQDKICIGGDRNNCEDFDDIDTGYAGYVPEVNGYLGNTDRPINKTSYQAALFWTYLTEKFGTDPPASDSVERGMNFIVTFWENSANDPGRDGVAIVNETLGDLGHSESFRDVWKDFAVANYAKNITGSGVQSKYQYADMAEPGGSYDEANLHLSEYLSDGEQVIDTDETVRQWGARYYEVRPASDVSIIDIKFTQDSTYNLYYTILAVKNGDVVYEYNSESRHLSKTLVNDSYDEVVVIVAGLEHQANFRYSFNGTSPTLNIIKPTFYNKGRVGDWDDPGKFLVQLEVLAGDGTPLEGVDIANFAFDVGTKNVPSGNILTSATVQGEHWFVIRAPAQDSAPPPTDYDFTATYSNTTLTDSETSAVRYAPRDNADNMIILDHSGSMNDDSKMESARDAAKLYVDSWQTGNTFGIVGFSTSASLEMDLQPWDSTSRSDAIYNVIPNPPFESPTTGATAIGEALDTGWNELQNDTDASTTNDWVMVLLSDGLSNEGTPDFDTMINNLQNPDGTKQPQVHAIAVGPDADRLRMQKVANVTGGTYQAVSVPGTALAGAGLSQTSDNLVLDMDYRYRVVATEALGKEQFYHMVGPMDDTDPTTDTIIIPVEGSASELIISLSWDGNAPGTSELYDPDGNFVDYTQSNDEVRYKIWRIPQPQAGDWRIEFGNETVITGLSGDSATVQQTSSVPPYFVHASVRSDVEMDVYLPTAVDDRLPGVPMPIIASLTDNAPITGATIVADVENPNGDTTSVMLYDDGNHGDGAADDGIYSGIYYQTLEAGSYNITVTADGNSSIAGDFTREALLGFHIFTEDESEVTQAPENEGEPIPWPDQDNDNDGNPDNDRDGDGLPDRWEEENGTDPDRDDANEDPDQDGSPNSEEAENGTDPHNPDSDGGGESDGSEADRGSDPHDPSDDEEIHTPWVNVIPRDGTVFVWHSTRSNTNTVEIYRSTDPDGPYTLLGEFPQGTGIYTDTDVTNDTRYCYVVVMVRADGVRSSHRDPVCVTPMVDPEGPHGGLLINQGAQVTTSPDVMLTLFASDDFDPESETPDNPIPPPASDSSSGVTDMKIGNEADLEDGTWETYATSKTWTLSDTIGLSTAYVQYRDAMGNESAIYPASIRVVPDGVVAATGITIDGNTTAQTHQTSSFTATVSPSTATTPVSYTWSIDGPDTASYNHPGLPSTTDMISMTWQTVGIYTVTVQANNTVGAASDMHTIEVSQLPMNITLEAGQSSLLANSSTTISATLVRDASGEPVEDVPISFESNRGTINPSIASTDANGVATTVLQSDTSMNTATVIGRTGSISDSVEVEFIGTLLQNNRILYVPLLLR